MAHGVAVCINPVTDGKHSMQHYSLQPQGNTLCQWQALSQRCTGPQQGPSLSEQKQHVGLCT